MISGGLHNIPGLAGTLPAVIIVQTTINEEKRILNGDPHQSNSKQDQPSIERVDRHLNKGGHLRCSMTGREILHAEKSPRSKVLD